MMHSSHSNVMTSPNYPQHLESVEEWNQERLHKWTMWRMSVNQELIQGLYAGSGNDGLPSHTNSHSITRRYLEHPAPQKDQTSHVRHVYGNPPSQKCPMGDNLYYLYGLPRVTSSCRIPDVVSSHYASMPNLASVDEPQSRQNLPTRVPPPLQSPHFRDLPQIPATNIDQRPHKRKNVPRIQQNKGTENEYNAFSGGLAPRNEHDNRGSNENPMYLSEPMTYLDRVSELNSDRGHASPVNFRFRPEADRVGLHNPNNLNNINKPVVIPPAVFQNEVQARSMMGQSPDFNGLGGNLTPRQVRSSDDGFEDPRQFRRTEWKEYSWNEPDDVVDVERRRYVDESNMKTHM